MWRLKQLMPKDQAGLEGKTLDVGSLRLQIRSTIAQGGFSRVYLARDAQSGKTIALKHIICMDSESLDLVKKEVSALKAFCGHPNIIRLEAQSMYETNGTKDCFLAMECCEKTMVDVLDNRGAGYYEERQLLLMFRDVCNAVCAMHSQSPPMAHRDLKAENLLLGSDGHWKLCDFGSVSTNHRRFDKAADMGLEEDIIRKHTTPAYRAPEMWDLYSRDIISEKVDIWALGCLLYRMAYFKSAFDGESKLQILNVNYRLPELPNYSSVITGLIKDMLQSSPEKRPTAMQLWQRVNAALPVDYQKKGPDILPVSSMSSDSGGNTSRGRQPSVMPTRAPPPPPHKVSSPPQKVSPPPHKVSGGLTSSTMKEPYQNARRGGGLGSFWSTQYAQGTSYDDDDSNPAKDKLTTSELVSSFKSTSLQGTQSSTVLSEFQSTKSKIAKKKGISTSTHARNDYGGEPKWDEDKDNHHDLQDTVPAGIGFLQEIPHVGNTKPVTKDGFTEFVADFENASIFNPEEKDLGRESWQAECESLRAELQKVRKEVLEISTKCEKLTTICESQQLESQQLKSALTAANTQCDSVQAKERASQSQAPSSSSLQKQEQTFGTIWDREESLQSPMFSVIQPPEWEPFNNDVSKMLGTAEIDKPKVATMRYSGDSWESQYRLTPVGTGFSATRGTQQGPEGRSAVHDSHPTRGVSHSSGHGQPAGWSAF